jgi:cbb3-type cytochrome oxidase maturation protein
MQEQDMVYIEWLLPIALAMGFAGLLAFLWSMRNGQLEDLDGAAARVLLADASDGPLVERQRRHVSNCGSRSASTEPEKEEF